jgi:hypothetical protein
MYSEAQILLTFQLKIRVIEAQFKILLNEKKYDGSFIPTCVVRTFYHTLKDTAHTHTMLKFKGEIKNIIFHGSNLRVPKGVAEGAGRKD